MAFILEKISEEDKKKYNINPTCTDVWAIDRDRNIFLLYNGIGGYSEVWYYGLYLNGYIIKITTEDESIPNKNEPTKRDVFYRIVEILIPIQLKEKNFEVEEIIREALRTWGCMGVKELTATVSISYPEKNDPSKSRKGIRFINSEKLN